MSGEIFIPKEHKETLLQELETMGIQKKHCFQTFQVFLKETLPNLLITGTSQRITTLKKSEKRRPKAMNKEALSEDYFQRANVRVALGKYEKAIADYERAIELKPDYVEAYNQPGIH